MTFWDSAHQSHKIFKENYSLRSIGELRICIAARARGFNSAMSARIGKPWAQRAQRETKYGTEKTWITVSHVARPRNTSKFSGRYPCKVLVGYDS